MKHGGDNLHRHELVLEPPRKNTKPVNLRTKIFLDGLRRTSLKRQSQDERDVAHLLSLGTGFSPEVSKSGDQPSGLQKGRTTDLLPGSLTESDLQRFGACMPHLSVSTLKSLDEELKLNILSIAEFFHDETNRTEEERLEKAWTLPDRIQSRLEQNNLDQKDLEARYDRIKQLVNEIDEIYPVLQENLMNALSTFPPVLNDRHSASCDLIAAVIETSLVKLSVIRARAHQFIYGQKSQTNADTTMMKALMAAHSKLQKDESRLAEEEKHTDRQLEEYQGLLLLVDGGGFAQVVEDWIRVQKEIEECKRDLRRLGWTGDSES